MGKESGQQQEQTQNSEETDSILEHLPGGHLLQKPEGEKREAVKPAPKTEVQGEQADGEGEEIAGEEGAETAEENEGESSEEGEEQEESEGEDQENEDEELEVSEEDSKAVKALKKRVNQLTKRSKTAEEKLAEAEKEKSPQPPAPVAETTGSPLDRMWHPQEVQGYLEEAQGVEDWAVANPEGGEVTQKDGTKKSYDAAEVEEIRINARNSQRAAEKRIRFLTQTIEREGQTRSEFSEWFDNKKPEFKELQSAIRSNPGFERLVDGAERGIVYALGLRELKKLRDAAGGANKGVAATKGKGEGKPAVGADGKPVTKTNEGAARRPIAPPVPKTSAGKPAGGKTVDKEKAMDGVMKNGGSVEALTEFFGG